MASLGLNGLMGNKKLSQHTEGPQRHEVTGRKNSVERKKCS